MNQPAKAWIDSWVRSEGKAPRPRVAVSAEAVKAIENAAKIRLDEESQRCLEALINGRVMYVLRLADYGTAPPVRLPLPAQPEGRRVFELAQDLLSAMGRCNEASGGRSRAVLDHRIGHQIGIPPTEAVRAIANIYKHAFTPATEEKRIGRGQFIRDLRDQVWLPLTSMRLLAETSLKKFVVAIDEHILAPLDQAGIHTTKPDRPTAKKFHRSKRPTVGLGGNKAIEKALSREVVELDRQQAEASAHWEAIALRAAASRSKLDM